MPSLNRLYRTFSGTRDVQFALVNRGEDYATGDTFLKEKGYADLPHFDTGVTRKNKARSVMPVAGASCSPSPAVEGQQSRTR